MQIPVRHRDALRELARLTNAEFKKLTSALEAPSLTTSFEELRQRMAQATSASDDLDGNLLLDALLGASNLRRWKDESAAEVGSAVGANEGLELTEKQRAVLSERFGRLLDSPSIEVLAKGIDVLTECERVFLGARIVTDIRPAYRASELMAPAGAVLVHTLKIDVHENGQKKPIYISMDESDLLQLQGVISRENIKSAGLRQMLQTWGLSLIDLAEPGDPT